jgi:hypothetical protein
MVRIDRLIDRPIIGPALDHSIGQNIQGPSLIRVPEWVASPLGRYYLYFAHHKGTYIRLATADALTGPWRIHVPGSLHLQESGFLTTPPTVSPAQRAQIDAAYSARGVQLPHDVVYEATTPHIASPDVHVDDATRRIRMYVHGLHDVATQVTRVAESRNGIDFTVYPQVLGRSYMRVFHWAGVTYALAMPGQFYRSTDGLPPFALGPRLFNPNMRHAAVLVRGATLYVFWTQVGDAPERILVSTIDLSTEWMQWQASAPVEVLRPERAWEGAGAPLAPSIRSTAYGPVNQLRDPAIYVEGERVFLLYAVAGESGIALAEVVFDEHAWEGS